jgi:hypothetical protein
VTGQEVFLAGHCSLTGRYFEPSNGLNMQCNFNLIDNSHYRLILKLGKEMVAISARKQKYTKFANFARLYFPHFTTFRNQTLQIY